MDKMVARDDDDFQSGFHNPLFSTNAAAPKEPSLFPQGLAQDQSNGQPDSLSTLLMRRHGRRDGRKDGATVDITRRRSNGQLSRLGRVASSKRLQCLGSINLPACTVIKSGDASDAGEVLQHRAFCMETFRVYDENAPASAITFRFVFNPGTPSQAVLEATHVRPTPPQEGTPGAGDMRMGSPGGEGKVRMTLGGMNVLHVIGEPLSVGIRQVGTVTFNPRKQAKGNYLYILSQEQRTLFTSFD